VRGNTKSHRRPGCTGSGRDKSKVWPGKKLPGHMGGMFIRQRGIRVLRINYEHNILYLYTNNIPGEPGEFVYVFDTKLPHK
jgi:large subunit ribosomal protein L3